MSRKAILSKILESLDSIPNINRGGCGISALAIYRALKQKGVIVSDRPFVILLTYGDEWEIQNNSKHFARGSFDCLEFAHVAIELNKQLIDSSGEVDTDYFALQQPERLNESELLDAINNDPDWNVSFDREDSIPLIELALRIDLSDVEQ